MMSGALPKKSFENRRFVILIKIIFMEALLVIFAISKRALSSSIRHIYMDVLIVGLNK